MGHRGDEIATRHLTWLTDNMDHGGGDSATRRATALTLARHALDIARETDDILESRHMSLIAGQMSATASLIALEARIERLIAGR